MEARCNQSKYQVCEPEQNTGPACDPEDSLWLKDFIDRARIVLADMPAPAKGQKYLLSSPELDFLRRTRALGNSVDRRFTARMAVTYAALRVRPSYRDDLPQEWAQAYYALVCLGLL